MVAMGVGLAIGAIVFTFIMYPKAQGVLERVAFALLGIAFVTAGVGMAIDQHSPILDAGRAIMYVAAVAGLIMALRLWFAEKKKRRD